MLLTAWGYEAEDLPSLLSIQDFNSMTGNRYAGDMRAVVALDAASQAVRNACGWHVSPSLECRAVPLLVQPRLVALPANAVTVIAKVTENGTVLSSGQYEWRRDGLIRRACFECWPTNWNAVEVEYTAGFDADAVPDLKEAVRSIAEGVLAVAAGVNSESADGVSISYSANASSIAAALTEQQRAALAPYRLVVSHAA